MGTLLEVRNLKTHFFTEEGTVKAVDDISYDLNEGEFVAIVGESGCGKRGPMGALVGLGLCFTGSGPVCGFFPAADDRRSEIVGEHVRLN